MTLRVIMRNSGVVIKMTMHISLRGLLASTALWSHGSMRGPDAEGTGLDNLADCQSSWV